MPSIRSKTIEGVLDHVFSKAHVPAFEPKLGTHYPTLPTIFPTKKAAAGMIYARLPLMRHGLMHLDTDPDVEAIAGLVCHRAGTHNPQIGEMSVVTEMEFRRNLRSAVAAGGIAMSVILVAGAAWLSHPSKIDATEWNVDDDQLVAKSECERDKAAPDLRHVHFTRSDYASFFVISDDEFETIGFQWDGNNSVRTVKGVEIRAGNVPAMKMKGRRVRDKVAVFNVGKSHVFVTAIMRMDYDVLDTVRPSDYERYLRVLPTIVATCISGSV